MLPNRFVPHSDDDIQSFVNTETNKNTKKEMTSDIALVRLFLRMRENHWLCHGRDSSRRFKSIFM